jgi:hypothetical protein
MSIAAALRSLSWGLSLRGVLLPLLLRPELGSCSPVTYERVCHHVISQCLTESIFWNARGDDVVQVSLAATNSIQRVPSSWIA